MKINLYSLVAFLILIAQHSNAQEKFLLDGTLHGFEDSTKVIINLFLPNMTLDMDNETTTYLHDGKFRFEDNLENPTKISLRVRPKDYNNFSDYEHTNFWVENKRMNLEGEKGAIWQSKIQGSKIQDEYYEHTLALASYMKILKEITAFAKTSQNLSEEKRKEMRSKLQANQIEYEKIANDFIFNHPEYYSASAELVFYITYPGIMKLDKEKVIMFYNKLPLELKNNIYGSQIKNYTENNDVAYKQLKVGDKPYLFSLPDSSENTLALASLKSKYLLLDFWASGCGPCRTEHKNYLALYKKYKSEGFEILSVSQDNSKRLWLQAVKKDNMIWKSVWDSDRKVTKMYNVTYIPLNYLINSDGIIIGQNIRGKVLSQKLEGLFKK